MTHDELLARIGKPFDEGYQYADIVFNKALRAVVELHKPTETTPLACRHCDGISNDYAYSINYPCRTIQAIEKELTPLSKSQVRRITKVKSDELRDRMRS